MPADAAGVLPGPAALVYRAAKAFAPNPGAERWIDQLVRDHLANGSTPAHIGAVLAHVIEHGLTTNRWSQSP
jgi:hypothetical protein